MNSFQDILAFVRVVELGAFTAAAKSLGVSVSSITKSVSRLEEDLGIALLVRSTRRIRVTAQGRTYHDRCQAILRDLAGAEDAIRNEASSPRGSVRLWVPPAFGRQTVIPALPAFFERYPDIDLDLHFGHRSLNLIEGGYDLAVASGTLHDTPLAGRLLVRGPQKTVASPAYLARHGTPRTPDDVSRHRCVVGRFGNSWSFRTPSGATETVQVRGPLSTDSGDALREAAVAGIGLCQATWWLFRQDIERGALVPVLEAFETEADPITIVFPPDRSLPARVRAVIDFLVEITREQKEGG